MTISTAPEPPNRNSPSDFSTKADALLAWLVTTFIAELNATATAMNLNATTSTSATSLAIGTGSKSLTVETDKSYQVGQSIKVAFDSSNWMHGEVTSYNAGTGALVVNVSIIKGSGTKTAWTVTLSGPGVDTSSLFATSAEFIIGTESAKALAPNVVNPIIRVLQDNIMILAWQLATSNAGFSFENGAVDNFATQDDVNTGACVNQSFTTGYYQPTATTPSLIDRTTGTAIGTMTGGGNLASGFDGVTTQHAGSGPALITAGLTAYIGKDWGVGVTKTVTGFRMYACDDYGFGYTNTSGTVTITLQGSTDNFSSSIVDLGSTSALTDSAGQVVTKFTGITTTTAYRYHRLKIVVSSANGNNMYMAEAQFFEGTGTINNMTLVSSVATARTTVTTGQLMLLVEPIDTLTYNTDLIGYMSADNGAHWETAVLVDKSAFDASKRILSAPITFANTGTQVLWKVVSENNKNFKSHAVGIYYN